MRPPWTPAPDEPSVAPLRICGHCGAQISGERCTPCEWRHEVTLEMLTTTPDALPSCPWCFNKGFKVSTGVIGVEQPANELIKDCSWHDEGVCFACGHSVYEWQRNELARRLRAGSEGLLAAVREMLFANKPAALDVEEHRLAVENIVERLRRFT